MEPDKCSPFPSPRRFVTRHNTGGVAIALADGPPRVQPYGDGSYGLPLWSTTEAPANLSNGAEEAKPDPSSASIGSYWTAYDIPPGFEGPMHRSVTLDYVFVSKGTIVLTMEDGSRTELHEGDTIVQRATLHKWSNESTEWARMMSVMIPAHPVIVEGGRELKAVWPYEVGPGK